MNLYEINSALQAAVDDCIDPETGEILDDSLLDAIGGLQMARDEKIENLCLYIKNLRSDADQLKAEKQAFAKRQAAAEAKADRLTKYLSDVLAGEKWKAADGRAAISYRKTTSVSISDLTQIPAEFTRIPDPVPDKTAIKNAIQSGQDVPGAEIVTGQSIQIR